MTFPPIVLASTDFLPYPCRREVYRILQEEGIDLPRYAVLNRDPDKPDGECTHGAVGVTDGKFISPESSALGGSASEESGNRARVQRDADASQPPFTNKLACLAPLCALGY